MFLVYREDESTPLVLKALRSFIVLRKNKIIILPFLKTKNWLFSYSYRV